MAEANNEKQHIRLNICKEVIDIYVKRGGEEAYYRSAAEIANSTYTKYAELFRGRRSERFIAATALLEIGVKYQMEHADKSTDAYNHLLERLTSDIDEALK